MVGAGSWPHALSIPGLPGVLCFPVPLTFLISSGQPLGPAKLHAPPSPGSHPGRLRLLWVGGLSSISGPLALPVAAVKGIKHFFWRKNGLGLMMLTAGEGS